MLLVSIGAICTLFVVMISLRMGLKERAKSPIRLIFGMAIYWPWLLWKILWSNIEVSIKILQPELKIQPEFITIRHKQSSDLCRVIYANSITLTPGTVTIEEKDDEFIVHTLTRSAAQKLLEGKMDSFIASMDNKE